MVDTANRDAVRLDVLGLFLAGLINTFLATFVAGVVVGPGTTAFQTDLLARVDWITMHTVRWQSGWFFWFAVTLSFAWSYFALGRHLNADKPWPSLAVGVAVMSAAVDLVGVLVYMSVLPDLAMELITGGRDAALQTVFLAAENLAYALTNVTGFGLYTLAGLLLLPAAFATANYPRWLAWLGVAEWSISTVATALLVVFPDGATMPMLVGFALYAPWVWGSALWLYQGKPRRLMILRWQF